MSERAVFLDRDGVLNEPVDQNGQSPRTLEDFELSAGAPEACARLRDAGYRLIVVTNQPDVARGKMDAGLVDQMNEQLRQAIELTDIRVCPHDDPDPHGCRKPLPGLLTTAAGDHGIDLGSSYMVGDRWKDVEAGRSAGCTTILIDRPWSEGDRSSPDHVVSTLEQAADLILSGNGAAPRAAVLEDAPVIEDLTIKFYADGADIDGMKEAAANPIIQGFTTNPTLMRKAGVSDYRAFAHEALEAVPGYPISFEVIADDPKDMERQAAEIASWSDNAFVKIPVTDPTGVSSMDLVRKLSEEGVKVNVTAITTLDQVRATVDALAASPAAVVSVFAGRVADTGRDPCELMAESVRIAAHNPKLEVLWASPRELLNVFQADAVGCHIITLTDAILSKLNWVGRDLDGVSLDTVKMFHSDAAAAGYTL